MVNVTIDDLTLLVGAIADGDLIEIDRQGAPDISRKVTKINFVTDIDNADIAAGAAIATSKLADSANFVLINQANVYDAFNQDFRSGNLRLANPANTFHYALTAAAIVANRTLNLPLLAATDTLAVLALAQNFITGRKDFFDTILGIRNPADTFSYIFRSAAIIANRDVSLPLLTANDTIAMIGFANLWGDGIKQTFNPDATTPGINFGSQAGDPSTPANGDVWYNSTSNKFRARENGANADFIGGGGLTFARVVKPDDESVTSSTVLQDDDDITVALSANTTYGYMCIISFDADGTGGLKWLMSIPAGAVMEHVGIVRADSPTTTLDSTTERGFGGGGAGVIRSVDMFGRIKVAGTAGNVLFRWAQNSSNATPTIVLEGTYIVLWEEV